MYGACVLATGCMEVYLGMWLVLPKAAVMCILLLVHVWRCTGGMCPRVYESVHVMVKVHVLSVCVSRQ